MKLRKLNARGFSHDLVLIAFVVIFAISGVAYLVASHADSCSPVSSPVSSREGSVPPAAIQNCTPASVPTSTPVSTTINPNPGEQLSIPPARRPAQYVHICFTPAGAEYVTQGTPNCLPGGIFKGNYGPNVAGTVYSIPCKTTGTQLRYAYVASGEACPAGTVKVATQTGTGEQLSVPPQRRPVQYVHVCATSNNKTVYVTQGTPNCLSGGIFQFNYDPSVPGTYYSIPCATNSNSTSLRYVYISSGETCPSGTIAVSKT